MTSSISSDEWSGRGRLAPTCSRFKKVLNSWLSCNGINVKLKVNIRGESDTPRIADEKVPNKEELDRILRMATCLLPEIELKEKCPARERLEHEEKDEWISESYVKERLRSRGIIE
jgi:hypothetical protein